MACLVKKCKSRMGRKVDQTDDNIISFHRFPSEEFLRKRWTEALALESQWIPKKHHRVCSKHFSPACFVITGDKCRRLKYNSVPTLFLSSEKFVPTHLTTITSSPEVLLGSEASEDEKLPMDSYYVAIKSEPLSDTTVATNFDAELLLDSYHVAIKSDPLSDTTVATLDADLPTDSNDESISNTLSDADAANLDLELSIKSTIDRCYLEKLEKKIKRLQKISNDRLKKIKALKQRNRRLEQKNVVINNRLIQVFNQD